MKRMLGLIGAATAAAMALTANPAVGDSSKPEPRFKLLPSGSIQPAGWMKAQLEQDARGGILAYFHRSWQVQNRAFELRGHNPAKKDKQPHFWDGAAEGYWGFALISSAILANDPALKQRADAFVTDMLKTQDADGYIGIFDAGKRYQPETVDMDVHRGFLFQGLLYYAQAYGRKDVLEAVERAVQCDMRHFNRSTTNLWVPSFVVMSNPQFLDALAQATGKKEYAEYGAFLVENYSAAPRGPVCFGDARLKHLLQKERPYVGHACNTTGNLSLPWLDYFATGNAQYKEAGENAFVKFERQMSVGGSLPGAEDNYGRPPLPDIGVEFCTTTYLVENALIVAEKTGQSRMVDLAERCFFNAGMGARLPDGTAHAYLRRDSEFSLDPQYCFHRYQYSPAHEPFCCTTRMMSLLPVYVSHMFKKTADGHALAALGYGPAMVETAVAGVKVRVEEKTLYPFEGQIEFRVQAAKPVRFDLLVRVPTWAPGAEIKCAGAKVSRQGDYYVVNKEWGAGDVVNATFETPVEAIRWVNNEYVLKSGPLVFAAKLDAVPVKHEKFPSGHTVQELSDGKLPIYGYTPGRNAIAGWNMTLSNPLKKSAFGFKRITVKTKNPDQPWQESPLRLQGPTIAGRTLQTNTVFVPMGCTILRRVTFPAGYSDGGDESSSRGADTMVDEDTSF